MFTEKLSATSLIKLVKEVKSGPMEEYWKKSMKIIIIIIMSLRESSFLLSNLTIVICQNFFQMMKVITHTITKTEKDAIKLITTPFSKSSTSSSGNGQSKSSSSSVSEGILEVPSGYIKGSKYKKSTAPVG
jgi:hypothetical protein